MMSTALATIISDIKLQDEAVVERSSSSPSSRSEP